MSSIVKRTFDDIVIGDSVGLMRTIGDLDIELFAIASGDGNPSHMDAAALCKMADRSQIAGVILDCPLRFDNAAAPAAAAKGIVSPVACRTDILVVPHVEAGNTPTKQLEYLADARIGAVVHGARVPIILASRTHQTLATLASCAIALLLARHECIAAKWTP